MTDIQYFSAIENAVAYALSRIDKASGSSSPFDLAAIAQAQQVELAVESSLNSMKPHPTQLASISDTIISVESLYHLRSLEPPTWHQTVFGALHRLAHPNI